MTHVLHQSAMQLAKQYLQCERELLRVLQDIDDKRLFIDWGYSSLFDYCRQALKLSESQSYNFVAVSRRCLEVPALQQAIQSEQINLSRAKRILPVIDVGNAAQWIEKAATMDQRQLEREVAAENPVVAERPSLKPSSATRFILHTGISEEIQADVEKAMEILSRGSKVSLEEAVGLAFKILLDKIDPLRKLVRNQKVKAGADLATSDERALAPKEAAIQQAAPTPASPRHSSTQRYIPAHLKREIYHRDGNQCRHLNPNKTRCTQRAFLEIHHVVPLADGGKTTLDNLITVCSGHHSYLHRKKLPLHPTYLSRTGKPAAHVCRGFSGEQGQRGLSFTDGFANTKRPRWYRAKAGQARRGPAACGAHYESALLRALGL